MITGASRGIGLALARRVAENGDRVALLARGETIGEVAGSLGPNAIGVRADVGDRSSIDAATAQIAGEWGGIDVLVNNAGLHRGGKVDRLSVDDWDAVFGTNVRGPYQVAASALEYMEEGASIVNIGAVVGFRGFAGDAAYGSSKAGLAGLTRVLSIELARRGIRANMVIPGLVRTEMTSGLSPKAQERLVNSIPMRRYGGEDEIAEVIWWVAGASYMTGSIVPVDGGLMSGFGSFG